MDDFEKELKVGFLDEASQAIDDAEQCFLSLESDPENSENLNKIFRLAHNLKGSSKAVGFDGLSAFTHEFENFILKIKNGQLTVNSQVVNILLQANDHVMTMIAGLKENFDAQFDSQALLNEMVNFSGSDESGQAAEEQTVLGTSAENVGEFIAKHEPSIEEILEIENARIALEQQKSLETTDKKIQQIKQAVGSGAEESIRVSLSKVEKLIDFVSEMLILQSVMKVQIEKVASEQITKTSSQISKITKEIQDISMGLRMNPIKPIFQKMQRIVRDTSYALNKDVSIELVGEETELDKTVLEKINDPLVHLIRNSVDHGIESAEDRLKSGKLAKGNVKLSAYHQSGKLVIEVSDDGAGLNPEKLIKKAIEKKILAEGAKLSDQEAWNLIFAAGFSTKETVTDVSGRGVGMDVVRTNIREMNGDIKITSEIGKGTTFKITLPLTLAIIDSMTVEYSKQKYIIPLNSITETLKPNDKMIQYNNGIGEVLMLRSENLPLFRLGDFFGIKNTRHCSQMIAIVIRTDKTSYALLVDDIIQKSEVVTKPLSNELAKVKGISAMTILGDGKPVLILDPNELTNRKRIITPNSTNNTNSTTANKNLAEVTAA